MKRALAAVSSGLALLAASGAGAKTICVTPTSVTSCANHTIQAGVNAAVAGDIVKVAAGVYSEAVTVPSGKDNLQIVGAGRTLTIIDPDVPHAGANGITVLSTAVKIMNLGIRNGTSAGIRVTGANAFISGVRVVGIHGSFVQGIYVSGGNSQVLGCEVRASGGEGIVALGDNNVVKLNTLSQVSRWSIYVVGNNNQIVSNKVTNAGLAPPPIYGISASSNGTGKNVITGNILENIGDGNPGSSGIYVFDPEPTVQANKLTWAGRIDVSCFNCNGGRVSLNSVLGSPGIGFNINSIPVASPAARLVVQGNKAAATREVGFEIQGPAGLSQGKGILVQQNAASETVHPFPAFRATGGGHTFASNTALNSGGSGFYARGDNLLFQSNLATKSNLSGFVVDGFSGATLYANRAVSSVGQGFALYNSPSGTTGALNTGSLNRQDFCNEGPFTTIGTFATTSTTCDIR